MTSARLTVLLTADRIAARVDELAADIAATSPPDFVMAIVLRGGFVFGADLARALSRHGARPTLDFVAASSYGAGTTSSGRLDVQMDLETDVAGRFVLVVDDILDTGVTLERLRTMLEGRGAAAVRLCCLLDKPERRRRPVTADFVGFAIADRFVVGYGLDYAGRYRELPDIAVIEEPD